MRHRKSGLKLNRNSSNRKALFRNLAIALIEYKVIKTTVPKAKELRRFIEPLITLAKEDTVANRRLAYARLNNKKAVGQLFVEFGKVSINRPGGYTRIIKAGYRAGDNAPMAYMEFIDRHEESPLVFKTIEKKQTTSDSQATKADEKEKMAAPASTKDIEKEVVENVEAAEAVEVAEETKQLREAEEPPVSSSEEVQDKS